MDPIIEKLVKLKGIDQRTPEWFAARADRFSASDYSAILPNVPELSIYYYNFLQESCNLNEKQLAKIKEKVSKQKFLNPYKSCGHHILEKVDPSLSPRFSNTLTAWGTKHEDTVKQIYKEKTGYDIIDVGFYMHDKYNFIGASPDGLIKQIPKCVEIKCPKARKFNKNDPVPLVYWCQMQLQMEVIDLDECIYIECYLKEEPTIENPDNVTVENFHVVNVPRSKAFFSEALKHLEIAYNTVQVLKLLKESDPSFVDTYKNIFIKENDPYFKTR